MKAISLFFFHFKYGEELLLEVYRSQPPFTHHLFNLPLFQFTYFPVDQKILLKSRKKKKNKHFSYRTINSQAMFIQQAFG